MIGKKSIPNFSKKEFEAFFKKYHRLAVVVSVKITNDLIASEDIVQDIFYYIWKNSHLVNPEESLKSYLLKSVKNRSLNYLRDKKHTTDIQCLSDNFIEDDYDYSKEERISLIFSEIEKLPPRCREILKLVVLEEKKYAEAAETLGISLNTVKTQMGLAYKQLRTSSKKLLLFLFSPFLSPDV